MSDVKIPTAPGLYEAAAYPIVDGYNGYLRTRKGQWYEVSSEEAYLYEFDLSMIEGIAPMTPLVPDALA